MLDAVISGFRVTREISQVVFDNLSKGRDDTIPPSVSVITPEWLTDVLQPHAEGVQVTSIEPLSEVSGTTTHARIALSYNEIGENSMLVAAAAKGWIDREKAILEQAKAQAGPRRPEPVQRNFEDLDSDF